MEKEIKISTCLHVHRRMEDLVINGMKDVNSGTNRIYYELDGEGDADSSTTPHNVDHHRDRKFHFLIFHIKYIIIVMSNL